jgi:hypothetical protein
VLGFRRKPDSKRSWNLCENDNVRTKFVSEQGEYALLFMIDPANKCKIIAPTLYQKNTAFIRSMCGMRNRIAHGYFEINLDIVWDTLQTALPELLKQLSAVCSNADDKG